jgi:bifunctional DNA-binding transcriptional regulator/antitoxin component of YhaV-PrlF toxin-antitoxin module
MPKVLSNTLTISPRGQLVLPIEIRQKLEIQNGGRIVFSFDETKNQVVLSVPDPKSFVQKWAGIIDSPVSENTQSYLNKSRKIDQAKEKKLQNPNAND